VDEKGRSTKASSSLGVARRKKDVRRVETKGKVPCEGSLRSQKEKYSQTPRQKEGKPRSQKKNHPGSFSLFALQKVARKGKGREWETLAKGRVNESPPKRWKEQGGEKLRGRIESNPSCEPRVKGDIGLENGLLIGVF